MSSYVFSTPTGALYVTLGHNWSTTTTFFWFLPTAVTHIPHHPGLAVIQDRYLGVTVSPNLDVFLKKVQTALTPPSSLFGNYIAFFLNDPPPPPDFFLKKTPNLGRRSSLRHKGKCCLLPNMNISKNLKQERGSRR